MFFNRAIDNFPACKTATHNSNDQLNGSQSGFYTMSLLRSQLISILTRRYPFLSGCGTIANSRFVRMAAGESDELAWARLDCGLKLFVPLNDYVGKCAYFVGDLDRKIAAVIRRIVRPGDHVLDIGANLGIVSLPVSLLVGERGIVHSFEPNPKIRDYLIQSVKSNNIENIRVHSNALGAEEGEIELAYPLDNAGKGTLAHEKAYKEWSRVKVAVKTLSAVVKELGLDKVRLVKIDVEGFEPEVLRGARDWLSSYHPDAFLFESNVEHDGDESDGVHSLLAEFGYSFYSIPKRLITLKLQPYHRDGGTPSHDTLAVSRESEQEILSRFTILR